MNQTVKKAAPSALTIAIAAIVCNIIWGTPYKLIKVMNDEMGISKDLLGDNYLGQVLTTISIRFIIAGVMTLIFAMCIRQNVFKVSKKQWGEVIIMGLVSTTAAYFFFNIGNVNITSTINSTLLAQSTIFFAVVLAHFAYANDKISKWKIMGLIAGFIGLVISQLTGGKTVSDMFSFSFLGEGFMLMYGLIAAIATMMAKRIGSSLSPFIMTGWNLMIGGVVLFFIGLAMGGTLSYITWTPLGVGLLLILALASAIPFSLWYWCAKYANLGEISVYKFVQPISGALLAVILGERFTMPLAIGLVLVCLSIIVINKPPKIKDARKVSQP